MPFLGCALCIPCLVWRIWAVLACCISDEQLYLPPKTSHLGSTQISPDLSIYLSLYIYLSTNPIHPAAGISSFSAQQDSFFLGPLLRVSLWGVRRHPGYPQADQRGPPGVHQLPGHPRCQGPGRRPPLSTSTLRLPNSAGWLL